VNGSPESPDAAGRLRRFEVALLVRHPTIDPAAITAALGLEPEFSHRVGEPRRTPKGTPLEGNYRDTRWRFSTRSEVRAQWFVRDVLTFVDRLAPHRDFLHALRTTGGTACLMIQFLDDEYYGDEIGCQALAKIVDLGLDLGIESFGVSQS
jgi:hypothetical protein